MVRGAGDSCKLVIGIGDCMWYPLKINNYPNLSCTMIIWDNTMAIWDTTGPMRLSRHRSRAFNYAGFTAASSKKMGLRLSSRISGYFCDTSSAGFGSQSRVMRKPASSRAFTWFLLCGDISLHHCPGTVFAGALPAGNRPPASGGACRGCCNTSPVQHGK